MIPDEELRRLPDEAKEESDRFFRKKSNVLAMKKDKPVVTTKGRIFRIFKGK
jgi:hypothetical protein